MTAPRFILIGNPENRRVSMFQQALQTQGCPPARVVSYLELLQQGVQRLADLPHEPALVRIDSAGESFEVERGLLRLGYEDAVAARVDTIDPDAIEALRFDRGRITCPRQAHLGFERLLRQLDQVLSDRRRWRMLNAPATIAELFDKRVTSRRYREAGIPVPEAIEGVESLDQLREQMQQRGWPSVFVKLSCSSSASCLAVYSMHGDGSAMTTTEMTDDGWYNSLRVRRVTGERLERLISFLLREGSQIERNVPKARLDGAFFDCRVLMVAGEPAFSVVRQNRHLITNLHLGGWRGKTESLSAHAPTGQLEAATQSCRAVARLHDSFQLGVDLMYEAGFGGHRVLEANAFGDLLANLARDGLSVYEWQVRQALQTADR